MTLLAPESKIEWVIYDSDRTITLQGKDFEWVNRRSWLRVVANDERTGRQVLWTFELGAPSQLIETGMYANSLRPGDVVTVTFHPRKDGSRAGVIVRGPVAR